MNRDRRDAGFTLLELLVAMTVLGVLTALLASGLNFGTRVWERERTQLDAASELQLVQDVLRRMIAQAIPLPPPTDGNAGAPESSFVGTDTSVRFLGPPPAQSLAGGIYAYRLQTSPHDGGVRLELEWRLLPPKMTKARPRVSNAAPEEADRLLSDQQVILLDHLSSAEFSF
ncbi:MAG TPA: type II secretion system protein, partial [Rhodospirillales bacterium]|nr:type II secretion system protein [Rhodospirillales bacterium]